MDVCSDVPTPPSLMSLNPPELARAAVIEARQVSAWPVSRGSRASPGAGVDRARAARAASRPGRATRHRCVARRSRLHRLAAWMRISLDVEVEVEEAHREAGRHTAGAALKLCDAIFGDAVPPLDGGRVARTGACSQAALPPLQLCGRRHVRTWSFSASTAVARAERPRLSGAANRGSRGNVPAEPRRPRTQQRFQRVPRGDSRSGYGFQRRASQVILPKRAYRHESHTGTRGRRGHCGCAWANNLQTCCLPEALTNHLRI
jgi:hypothetical protein